MLKNTKCRILRNTRGLKQNYQQLFNGPDKSNSHHIYSKQTYRHEPIDDHKQHEIKQKE